MRHVRSWRIVVIALTTAAAFLLLPAPALAQEVARDGSFVFQANADVTIPAGESRDAVIVLRGDALVMGEVDTLIVVDGTATLTGARVQALIVAGGTADIGAGSTVDQVRTLDSVYHAAPGAVVGSYETVQPAVIAAALAPLALAVWFGFAIAYLLAGLVVATIAGGQLRRVGAALTAEPVGVTLAALAVLIGLPLLMVALVTTIVGIPSGVMVALVVIPLLWFLGSLAVAVRIGDWVLLRLRGSTEASHPVGAAFIGLIVVGVLSLIPIIGFLIGLAGAGAALLVGWRAAFGGRPASPTISPQPGPLSA